MSKKTDALLAKAKEVENPSKELVDAIATFEGVDGITANHAEYDAVQDLMVAIEATEEVEAEAPKKRVNMKGVKMIGNRWHHADDNYARSFDTSKECAEHFNDK